MYAAYLEAKRHRWRFRSSVARHRWHATGEYRKRPCACMDTFGIQFVPYHPSVNFCFLFCEIVVHRRCCVKYTRSLLFLLFIFVKVWGISYVLVIILCIKNLLLSSAVNKCLANAKRPCDCRVLCLRLKSLPCSCAHSISDMTSFSCRDQGRDSVCPVLWMSTWRNSESAGKLRE